MNRFVTRLVAYCVAALTSPTPPVRFDKELWLSVVGDTDRFDAEVTTIHEHGACDDLDSPWWRYADHADEIGTTVQTTRTGRRGEKTTTAMMRTIPKTTRYIDGVYT